MYPVSAAEPSLDIAEQPATAATPDATAPIDLPQVLSLDALDFVAGGGPAGGWSEMGPGGGW